jgi:hypothetical protein
MAAAFDWTDERKAALRRMMDDGLSASQCAKELSRDGVPVSRNAVIGKARRIGWEWEAGKKLARPATRTTSPARPSPPAIRRVPAPNPLALADRLRARHEPPSLDGPLMTRGGWPKPANPESVNFWGLTSKTCRLPLWSDAAPPPFEAQMYCGRPVAHEGSSWCAGCRTILFTRGTLSEQRADDMTDLERRMRRPVGAW